MIFDLYFEINFKGLDEAAERLSFRKELMYKEISGEENLINFKSGYCISLNRRNFKNYFYKHNYEYLWIFGYVYTNKKYEAKTGVKPKLLTSKDLMDLRNNNPQEWYKLIKGSYVILIYNEETATVDAFTDFLNVLPLYYAFDGKRLIVSSNTQLMLKHDWVDKMPDKLAFGMQHLFDYMLGEHYFVKGIRRTENARHYSFSQSGKDMNVLWDVSSLKHEELLPKNDSLDRLANQLKENVNLYANYSTPILVSLTGGFDGRANIAMIDKSFADFKCYSYGMPGSKQIRVPEKLASHIGFKYEPLYLNKEFLDDYYSLSKQASYFSNGTAPIGFADRPFAFKKLNNYSDTIITGLFGSEILRPLHNNGIQVNDQSFEIFLNKNLRNGIKNAINNRKDFLFTEIDLKELENDLYHYFKENYFDKYKNYDSITRFFFFIIQEGLRKYFSQEVSIERVFVNVKFPYFDLDIVELIYKTSWAGMYNGFLGKSKVKRRKGQLLYAHIMKKFKPELMDIEMDRGYKPKALLYPFPFNYFKLAVGVYKAKIYMNKNRGNDTFKTEEWASKTLNLITNMEDAYLNIQMDKNKLSEPKRNFDEDRFLTYRHMASLKLFLSEKN